MNEIVSYINKIVWNPGLVVLLLGAGLFFSICTRMVQVRRFGMMVRSLFSKKLSNEAGQGTGAMVSAAADVTEPAQQGLAQAFSVYVDTLFVCTATALMILTSGTYNILDSNGDMIVANAPELGNNYAAFTQNAVDTVFAGFGSQFVSIAMIFFVYSTIMAYYFYSESSIIYLFRGRNP